MLSDPTDRSGLAPSGEPSRSSGSTRRAVRWLVWLLIGCTLVLAVFVALVLWANTAYNGYRLARRASTLVSQSLLGRVTVGRVNWRLRAAVDLITGTPTTIEIDDVRIQAPDGSEVVRAPRVTAAIRLWPLIAKGQLDVPLVRVEGGHCTLASMPIVADSSSLGLVAAFSAAKRSPRQPEKSPDVGGPKISLAQIEVRGTRFRLAIGPTAFDLPEIDVDGWLRIDGLPQRGGMQLGARFRLEGGTWQQNGLDVPLKRIRVAEVGIDGQTLSVHALQMSIDGAPARIDGKLFNLFDDARITIEARASLSGLTNASQRLLNIPLGQAAQALIEVRGPVDEPSASARFSRLALGYHDLRLERLEGVAAIDVAKMKLSLESLSAEALGGHVAGAGKMDLTSLQWQARVDVRQLDPGVLSASLQGSLAGNVTLSGRLDDTRTSLAVIDLSLRRKRRRTSSLLPPVLAIRGSAHLNPRILDLAGVTISAGKNSIHARGSFNLERLRSNVYLTLQLPRLGPWFERQIGVDPIRSASGRLHVTGDYPRLRMSGRLALGQVGYGAMRLKRLFAQLSLQDGTLQLSQLNGEGYGGRLRGEAALQLFDQDIEHPRQRPLLRASLRAERFDLLAMGLASYGTGQISADADLSGPLDELTGVARLKLADFRLQGDSYPIAQARVGLLRDRISLYDFRLRRERGGDLRARGELFHDGRVSVAVRARGFPLSGLPGLSGQLDGQLGGQLSGNIRVDGRLTDPRFAGELELADVRIRGAHLGAGKIQLLPARDAITLKGDLLAGRLSLDGFALMRPRPSLHLKLDFTRFPLHEVVPELAELGVGQITGYSSGGVRFDLDSKLGLTWATARLTELSFQLDYRPLGRQSERRLNLSNREPLLLTFSDDRLHVVTARLVSSTPEQRSAQAEFSVGGFLSTSSSDLSIRGNVPLGLAEFFLSRQVKRISGLARADVRLSGPWSALQAGGSLSLQRVTLEFPGFDRRLELPSAEVSLEPGKLKLTRLVFRVGERQLEAHGRVDLAPGSLVEAQSLDLKLRGQVEMGLLQLVFPEQLSFARGVADVELALSGPPRDPRAVGELQIGRIELRPRGLGRVITLQQGQLSFSNYLLCLGGESSCTGGGRTCETYERICRYSTPLRGTYDEGTIEAYGQARFDQSRLVDLELFLKGASIPQRMPRVYAAEFNADLRLVGDDESLALDGKVDIVDGRYSREFDILKDLVVRPRTYEETVPFWQGTPQLENMGLDVQLRSTGSLRVRNRNADLSLAAALSVGGTLSNPSVDGTVRVEEGSFRIPFLRGQYQVERGDISFKADEPAEKAKLDIVAHTQYVDRGGTDYRISMTLAGNLQQMRIRLSSQPHLDQGQILALLATGRTTDQWRAQLNAPDQGAAAAGVDTQVKELTGSLLGGMIGDPLERAFGLDLVRLEVGTETVTARACKNLGTAFEVCGEGEKNLLGGFGGKATANYKMHDYLRLMGRLERLSTRIEREQENPSRGRLELKFRLPLR